MIRRRWMQWGAVGTVAAFALTGCVGDNEPEPSTNPTTSSSPPSDSELEEVASDTAIRFTALTDEMYVIEAVPDALREVASDEIVANLEAEMQEYVDLGYAFEPASILENVTTESVERESASVAVVDIVACLDTSQSVVRDDAGNVVPPGGQSQRTVSFEVTWQNDVATVTGTEFPNASAAAVCAG